MRSMKQQYGSKKAERVFYASRNKGTIQGVEDSVFHTYRTMAYLLSEIKSTVEHEKVIRAKETQTEKEYQDWRAKIGKPRTPTEAHPDYKLAKAVVPENFPPHTTDPDSPEQVGQEAGIKAGDIRAKRLKGLAAQPVGVKLVRAIKKTGRRFGRATGKVVRRAGKAVRRAEKAIQIKDTAQNESVFNTYRTMAYLLSEVEKRPVIKHQATGRPYKIGTKWGHAIQHSTSQDVNVPETERRYRFRVKGDTQRRAVASLAAAHGSKTAKKDVKTLKKGSGVLTVRGRPGMFQSDSEGTQTDVTVPIAANPDTAPLAHTLDPKTTVTSRRTTSRPTDVTRPKASSVRGELTVQDPGGSLRRGGTRRPGTPEERETIITGRERGPKGKRVHKKGFPTKWSGEEAPPTDDT